MLLAQLPASSAFVEAQANDPDYAQWVASQPEGTPAGPRLSEWTPEVDALTRIYDRLGEVIAATIAAAGGKPGDPRPSPRPVTAIEKAKSHQRHQRHLSLVEEVKQAQQRWQKQRGG